jgi:hypothetical protein
MGMESSYNYESIKIALLNNDQDIEKSVDYLINER